MTSPEVADSNHYDPNSPEALACRSQPVSPQTCRPSMTNPRKSFPADKHAEMVESIKQHGVLQSLVVRLWPIERGTVDGVMPLYELVCGERRWRAAIDAQTTLIPAIVRNLSDAQVIELQIIENLQREDVSPLEEAEGYQKLMTVSGYTAQQVADRIGKSKAYVYASLKLCALCPEARELLAQGLLTASTALLIARIPLPALQAQAAADVAEGDAYSDGPMSYRDAKEHILDEYSVHLRHSKFPLERDDIVPATGACSSCPKRAGNNLDLYGDIDADVCTDPACNKEKKAAWLAIQSAEAVAVGKTVISGKPAQKLLPYPTAPMGKYVRLEDKCYDAKPTDKGYPTYAELIGDRQLPLTAIASDEGYFVDVVSKADLKGALEDAGVTLRDRDQDDRERAKAATAETGHRRHIAAQIHTRMRAALTAGTPLTIEDMRLMAICLWQRSEFECRLRVAGLWLPEIESLKKHEQIDAFEDKCLVSMPAAELSVFMMDLALNALTEVSSYSPQQMPPRLSEAAKRWSIPMSAVRDTSAPMAKTVKTPKTPAAKTASTPTQAAQAGETSAPSVNAEPEVLRTPAAGSPAGEWPFPAAQEPEESKPAATPAPKNAARAAKAKATTETAPAKPAKPKVKAASAAKATGKAMNSSRASSTGGKKKTTAPAGDVAPDRCDKTLDIFGEAKQEAAQ